jgi:hypothetical protein
MNKPKKKECDRCNMHDGCCCRAYNQACDDWEKWLEEREPPLYSYNEETKVLTRMDNLRLSEEEVEIAINHHRELNPLTYTSTLAKAIIALQGDKE